MLLLVIAIAALLAGVLALPLVRRRVGLLAALDGFVAVFVGGLVALHVLPEAIEAGGAWALGAGALGLVLPLAAHGLHQRRAAASHPAHLARRVLVALAALGLAAHAVIDGLALAIATDYVHHHHHHGHAHGEGVVLAASGGVLGLAVLAHKLPTGLALGRIVERVAGLRAALLVALAASATTVAAFLAAGHGLLSQDSTLLAVFNALVAGSLLHVVTGHHGANEHQDTPTHHLRNLTAGGALAALALGLGLQQPLAPLALLALTPLLYRTRQRLTDNATVARGVMRGA